MSPKFRVLTSTTHRAFLLSLLALAGCSGSPVGPSETVNTSEQPLLAAACTLSSGNLTLTVGDGDVAYVGRIAGCTTEPCVYANAKDSSGNLCTVASTKSITVVGDGTAAHVEKVVFDFSGGLFGVATTSTPLLSVTLDGTGATSASKVMVIPPAAGGNMALGSAGLVIDAGAKRTGLHVDMTIAGASTDPAPKFEFNGGAGPDIFTGDPANIPSTTFATSAALTTVLTGPTTLNLTLSGGAGNDILAGGAGTNTLVGGAGNDSFYQGTAAHAETIQGGDGVDTVDYSARTTPVFVTPNSETGATAATVTSGHAGTGYAVGDVISISGGTTGILAQATVATISSGAIATVTISAPGDGYSSSMTGAATTALTGSGSGAQLDITTATAANDGALTEGDSVAADVEIVSGGSANDVLNAHGVATTDVVLLGNGGDDKLTGGGGNDDLCGGAGNDRFYDNAGNDNLVGGAGSDTADYTSGTSVIACLNAADTLATKTCATQNGSSTEQDVVNATLAKVCPRATLNVAVAAGGTASVAPTTPGGPMSADVENLAGPAAGSTMRCGTLACTVFGGAGADTIVGSTLADQIFGLGGNDTVTANGGNDLIDLTGSASATETVDCGGNAVTLLFGATPTQHLTACSSANIP